MRKEVTFSVLQHEETGTYVANMKYSAKDKEMHVNGTKHIEYACVFDFSNHDVDEVLNAFIEQGFKVVEVKATYEINN